MLALMGAVSPRPLDIAVVNRFAPPDGAPTAAAAAALAEALAAALPSSRVTLFASRAAYRPGERDTTLPVARIPSLYGGKWPPGRLATSLLEGRWLARRAAAAADVVISLTDPPLLSLWTGPACRRRGRRWIEWTLDRYPEFFAAAGLVRAEHPLFRWLVRRDGALRPDAVIGLGAGQLRQLESRRGPLPPAVILPVGLCPPCPAGPEPGAPPTLVYAGTLGEAHDPAMVAAIAGRAAAAGIRVTLAASGRRAPELRRLLAGDPAVRWQDRLSEAELARADVHLVSLAGAAAHLSVPSKAVTAVCLGRPFLFAGPAEADTWQELGAAGWLVAGPAGIDPALAGLADPVARATRAAAARSLAAALHHRRDRAVATLAALIASWFTTAAP